MTDGELVRQVVAGNTAAYGELARRWFGRILAFCQSRVFTHEAEDLAQESFVRGFGKLSALSEPERFGPWMRGIATNVCADWLRNAMRHKVSSSNPGASIEQMVDGNLGEPAIAEDERAIIVQQVAAIPEELREVILLRYYENLTYDEMSRWLGVARATVNERLAKARALLRIRLAKLRSDV